MSACNVGDLGSIPGSGRSPGEGNGNPFQYSCLENPMDGGACGLQSMGSQTVSFTKFKMILSSVCWIIHKENQGSNIKGRIVGGTYVKIPWREGRVCKT